MKHSNPQKLSKRLVDAAKASSCGLAFYSAAVFIKDETLLALKIFGHHARAYLADKFHRMDKNDRAIKNLLDIHKGRQAWIIGNGPSVKTEDLEKFAGSITFCCNKFYMAYPLTSFRPSYTVTSDGQMIEDFGSEIVKKSAGKVFVVSETPPRIKGDYIWVRYLHKPGRPIRFSRNMLRYVMPGGSTVVAAIQIGYYMGIRNFYLYGIDHDFRYTRAACQNSELVEGTGNHFIANYREKRKWYRPWTATIEQSFAICDSFLKERRGSLKNATRGGKLEVLERIDFDDLTGIWN